MKLALAVLAAAAVALPALSVPAIARADDDDMSTHYSKTFVACTMEHADDAAMIDCTIAERKRWDKQLNAAYQKLMKSLPAARGAKLRDEERGWIKTTAAKCAKARADMDGVPVQKDIEGESCTLDETIHRTLYLRAYR